MDKELRSLHAKELRVDAADGSRTASGIVTYNTPSADLGGFIEIIAPGAFSDSINGDVLMLRDHQSSLLMGRTKSGTLSLSDTADGLRFSCKLPNTTAASDLAESISRSDLDGVSFGFYCLEDDWAFSEKQTVRTIVKAELFEISPCSFAAYPANQVSLRSCPAEVRSVLDKVSDVKPPAKTEKRDMSDDDTTDDGLSDCGCDCPECEDGDCMDCSMEDCNDPNCPCYDLRSMMVKIRLAEADSL